MTDTTIRCRARTHELCLHGGNWPYDHLDESGPWEDGTWDGETIVCDACYVQLMPYSPSGQLLLREIPAAIDRYRHYHPSN